eukprot:5066365-Prymnesium_polylepis.2
MNSQSERGPGQRWSLYCIAEMCCVRRRREAGVRSCGINAKERQVCNDCGAAYVYVRQNSTKFFLFSARRRARRTPPTPTRFAFGRGPSRIAIAIANARSRIGRGLGRLVMVRGGSRLATMQPFHATRERCMPPRAATSEVPSLLTRPTVIPRACTGIGPSRSTNQPRALSTRLPSPARTAESLIVRAATDPPERLHAPCAGPTAEGCEALSRAHSVWRAVSPQCGPTLVSSAIVSQSHLKSQPQGVFSFVAALTAVRRSARESVRERPHSNRREATRERLALRRAPVHLAAPQLRSWVRTSAGALTLAVAEKLDEALGAVGLHESGRALCRPARVRLLEAARVAGVLEDVSCVLGDPVDARARVLEDADLGLQLGRALLGLCRA